MLLPVLLNNDVKAVMNEMQREVNECVIGP